jgi:glycosyltransferase involved in cell wall biosynthesis
VETKHLEAVVSVARATLATIGRKYDVVHYHAVGAALLSPVARLLTRAKVVVTIHGLDAERDKWGRFATIPLRVGTWLSAHVPHATVVVSKALGEVYCERYGRATTHIVNGCPTVHRQPAHLVEERFGLAPGSYALFVGRLVPEKAPDLLIEAFRDVPGDVRLVIAGGSSYTDGYVARLRELAAADPRVLLAGYVYGDDLAALYSNAGVFVLPSHLEGLPLTLLEAAAYGCRVVASDIPPHVEVLRESQPGGHLFPAGDRDALAKALTEAFASDPAVEEAGAAALSARVTTEYSWDRASTDTLALYRRLGAERHRA